MAIEEKQPAFPTLEDLQNPRTPSQLGCFIEGIRRATRTNQTLRHAAIEKKGVFKQLVEEIIPVRAYALSQYPDDNVRISPILGNQGYDAEIHDLRGNLIERIEVTIPHDGARESKDLTQAVKYGYGECRVYEPGEEMRLLRPWLLETAKSKAEKDYSDATLLFVLALLPPVDSPITRSADMAEAACIEACLAAIKFQAKKVVLLLPSGDARTIHSQNGSLKE